MPLQERLSTQDFNQFLCQQASMEANSVLYVLIIFCTASIHAVINPQLLKTSSYCKCPREQCLKTWGRFEGLIRWTLTTRGTPYIWSLLFHQQRILLFGLINNRVQIAISLRLILLMMLYACYCEYVPLVWA